MKILHVVRQYHPSVGGLENFVANLASEQQKLGHQVCVLTLDRLFKEPQKKLDPEESIDGISVKRISYIGSSRYPISWQFLKHLKDYDLVHVHGIDFFFDILAWTQWIHRKPLVASSHGIFFHTKTNSWFKKLFFNTITRFSSLFYRQILCCSENDYGRFKTISPKAQLIHNGVEDKYSRWITNPQPSNEQFIYFGRLSHNKCIDKLILFVEQLKQYKPNIHLHIAGKDWNDLTDSLTQLIREKDLSNNISLHGPLKDQEIAQIIGQCKYYISASSYEGFGLAAVEAMYAGLTPILQPIPSFTGIIERAKLGLLIDFNKPSDAAKLFLQFEQSGNNQREQSQKAAQEYSWDKTALKFNQFYE